MMKKHLLIIPVSIVLAIFFYPTTSNSNSTGSVGGKTGSPTDGSSCTQCHGAQQGQGATITTDIPSTGYEPGNIYNITATINSGLGFGDPKGFEVTCEENTNNTKAGLFGTSDPINTQFTNNSNAVTHTAAGNSLNTWNLTWEAPIAGTGDITFYGAFIEAGYPIGNNQGDLFNSTSVSFNEAIVNSTINLSEENNFTFNSANNTIEAMKTVSMYDISGKLVLSTNEKFTTISHLNKGVYILKSENKTQKIIIK